MLATAWLFLFPGARYQRETGKKSARSRERERGEKERDGPLDIRFPGAVLYHPLDRPIARIYPREITLDIFSPSCTTPSLPRRYFTTTARIVASLALSRDVPPFLGICLITGNDEKYARYISVTAFRRKRVRSRRQIVHFALLPNTSKPVIIARLRSGVEISLVSVANLK